MLNSVAYDYLRGTPMRTNISIINSMESLISDYRHATSSSKWYYISMEGKFINKLSLLKDGKLRLLEGNGPMQVNHVFNGYKYETIIDLKSRNLDKYREIINEVEPLLFSGGSYLCSHPAVPISSGNYPSVTNHRISDYVMIQSATDWKASGIL